MPKALPLNHKSLLPQKASGGRSKKGKLFEKRQSGRSDLADREDQRFVDADVRDAFDVILRGNVEARILRVGFDLNGQVSAAAGDVFAHHGEHRGGARHPGEKLVLAEALDFGADQPSQRLAHVAERLAASGGNRLLWVELSAHGARSRGRRA